MLRVVWKMHHAFDLLGYFVRRQWNFPSNNIQCLIQHMKEVSPQDTETFYMDANEVNWPEYIGDCYMGFRRYLMKEPDSNIPQARKRLKRVSIAYKTFLAVVLLLVLSALYFFPWTSLFSLVFSMFKWSAQTVCFNFVSAWFLLDSFLYFSRNFFSFWVNHEVEYESNSINIRQQIMSACF